MATLARWGMFAFWSLVLWGTLWDLAVAGALVTRGFAAVAEMVGHAPPELAAAAWCNRACGLLAAFVWVVLPLARWSSSRRAA